MENLVSQGFELAIFGMGTVFVFLALLIFATQLMSSLILRFQPEIRHAAVCAATQADAATDNDRTVALISAAIAQHRRRQR